MPFKLTITTIRPAGSTVKWPADFTEEDNINMSQTANDDIHLWETQQPGFLDKTSSMNLENNVYEKNYIFDTQENAEAFLKNRADHELQSVKSRYFKEHGFISTKVISEV
jgi:hypothetical protein